MHFFFLHGSLLLLFFLGAFYQRIVILLWASMNRTATREWKRLKTHIWRWPDCGCSRLDWSTQTRTLWLPPRSGTSRTSWPTLLGCRALEEEEEQTQRIKQSLFRTSQSVMGGVFMCGRRIADEKMRRQECTVQDFVLNFVVWGLEKGFRCVRGT